MDPSSGFGSLVPTPRDPALQHAQYAEDTQPQHVGSAGHSEGHGQQEEYEAAYHQQLEQLLQQWGEVQLLWDAETEQGHAQASISYWIEQGCSEGTVLTSVTLYHVSWVRLLLPYHHL